MMIRWGYSYQERKIQKSYHKTVPSHLFYRGYNFTLDKFQKQEDVKCYFQVNQGNIF